MRSKTDAQLDSTLSKINHLMTSLQTIQMPTTNAAAISYTPIRTPTPTTTTTTPASPSPSPSTATTNSPTPTERASSMSRGNHPGSRFIPKLPILPLLPTSKTLQQRNSNETYTAPWRGPLIEERMEVGEEERDIAAPTFFHLICPKDGSSHNRTILDRTYPTKIISVPCDVDFPWFLRRAAELMGMKQLNLDGSSSSSSSSSSQSSFNSPVRVTHSETNIEITSMSQLRSLQSGMTLEIAWYESRAPRRDPRRGLRSPTTTSKSQRGGLQGGTMTTRIDGYDQASSSTSSMHSTRARASNSFQKNHLLLSDEPSIRELPLFDPDTLPTFVQVARHDGRKFVKMGEAEGNLVHKCILEICPTWTFAEFVSTSLNVLGLLRKSMTMKSGKSGGEGGEGGQGGNGGNGGDEEEEEEEDSQVLREEWVRWSVARTVVRRGGEKVQSMRELTTVEGGATLTCEVVHEGKNHSKTTTTPRTEKMTRALTEVSRFVIGSDLAFELEMRASAGMERGGSGGNSGGNSRGREVEESALVPFVASTALMELSEESKDQSNNTSPLPEMPWKFLWCSFVVSPPGGEARSVCEELARRRGYVHVSLDDAITREMEERTGLGRELLDQFRLGRDGLTPELGARVIRKAIYLAASDRAQRMTAPASDISNLSVFLQKEEEERKRKRRGQRDGILDKKDKKDREDKEDKKDKDGPWHCHRLALGMRFLIEGYPPSLNHAHEFEKKICSVQHIFYLELTEHDSLKCVLSTSATPMLDSNGNPTKGKKKYIYH